MGTYFERNIHPPGCARLGEALCDWFRGGCGRLGGMRVMGVGLAVVLLAGCQATSFHAGLSPQAQPVPQGSTLGVAPFENLSPNRHAGLAAADLASSILIAQGYFHVVEVGMVQDDPSTRLRRLELTPWERQLGVNPIAAAAVGRSLKADYILAGAVGEYGFVDGFGETATVGVTLRLVRSATGEVIWAGSMSRRVNGAAFSEESAHRLTHRVMNDLLKRLVVDLQKLQRRPLRAVG
jgi:TolB-like protein